MAKSVVNYQSTNLLNPNTATRTNASVFDAGCINPRRDYQVDSRIRWGRSKLVFFRLPRFLLMTNRISALTTILRSPIRILGLVLLLVFVAEVAVMFLLPYITPNMFSDSSRAIVDAVLLTFVCAPALWLVIIGPLRRIAIQEHERSETIVANASESILTFDCDGNVLSCNRAATDLFGVGVELLLGRSIRCFVPALPAITDELPAEFRIDAQRNNGERFPAQVSVSDYPSESQQTRIAIIRDLTEFEKAEQERITMARETEALRAQQMTTLAQLATGVAHEIRNPLTSIKMLIQVNRTRFAEEGLPTDDLEIVEQEIRRMERSVNSLLDYARPETSEFKRFSIQDVLRRTVQLVEGRCRSQNVTLNIIAVDEPALIDGDAAQVQQLLLNLALNALDAMPDGGKIDFEVQSGDEAVVVSVSDSGIGISQVVLDKLFTPFVTTKVNGVGLGLGICRRIAEAHGGTLTGFNQASGGAKFQLTLSSFSERSAVGKLNSDRGAFGHDAEKPCNVY